jgi:hypothetical protein
MPPFGCGQQVPSPWVRTVANLPLRLRNNNLHWGRAFPVLDTGVRMGLQTL